MEEWPAEYNRDRGRKEKRKGGKHKREERREKVEERGFAGELIFLKS
jgi:hypothetical protein